MKKTLVLTILGITGAVTVAYGQGTINFGNYFSSTSPRISYSSNPASAPPGKAGLALGGSWAAELAWFNGVTADPSQLSFVPASITYFSFNGPNPNGTADGDIFDSTHLNGNGAGWFLGPDVQLSGAPAGTTVTLQVWAFTGGSNPFISTLAGNSALFQRTLGGGPFPAASLAGFPNFVISIPEPSMFTLAGLGVVGLMAFRRKKT